MAKKNQPTLKQRQEYVEFLEKRLASSNFKSNVTEEEFNKTKEKLKKEKTIIGFLTTEKK